jgi:hypothetical protein
MYDLLLGSSKGTVNLYFTKTSSILFWLVTIQEKMEYTPKDAITIKYLLYLVDLIEK